MERLSVERVSVLAKREIGKKKNKKKVLKWKGEIQRD